MEVEERISKIERILLRIFGLGMALIAGLGCLVYAGIEFCKLVSHLWKGWS